MRWRTFPVCGVLTLLLLAGCATNQRPKVLKFTMQDPQYRFLSNTLGNTLIVGGRKAAACRFGVIEGNALNAFSIGKCRFLFTLALMDADRETIEGAVAHEVAHEILGHADKRQNAAAGADAAARALSFIPGIGGWIGWGAATVAGAVALPAYDRSQEYDADAEGVRLLIKMGHRNALQIMVHTLRTLMAANGGQGGGGILEDHPALQDRIARLETEFPSDTTP